MKLPNRTRLVGALLILAATGSASGAAAPGAEAGRKRVESYLQGLDGLQAQFKQVLTDRNGQPVDEASGTLAISRPDRFRWDYREPYSQVIVADGARIWIYDSDLEQVTVRKLDETLSATPASIRLPPPTLGQDTDAVLGELGYTRDEVAELRASGVV